MWRRLSNLLGRFAADRRGATVLIFGITMIPMLLGIGLAIDYSRALATKTRLGQAIDSAALAVGSWTDLNPAQIQKKAQAYFDANFPPGTLGSPGPLNVTVADGVITISVDSQVETTFMRLAGINEVEVSAFTEVTKNEKQIELVMVLDNTGSMGWNGKLDALKSAANALLDILMPDNENAAVYEGVKIGLVPFSASVNVGADKLNSGWFDANAQSSLAGEDFQSGVNVLDLYEDIQNRTWNGCVRARPAPYDTQDTAPAAGNPDTLWVPYFAPDEPDFSSYANRYAEDDGYGGSYWDMDARQRYTGKYVNLTLPTSWSDGPDFNCQIAPVTPLTPIRGDVESAINEMVATGNTVIPAGLSWGWRLVSPGEPFTEGGPYDHKDVIKAIVLLTDGQNDVSGGIGTHNRSQYSAYGFAQSGHMGAANGSEAEEVLDQKTATLCNNINAQDIRLYTITFQLSNGPIKDLMRNCASEPDMYYDSPTNAELKTVFQAIAKGLSDLRISK